MSPRDGPRRPWRPWTLMTIVPPHADHKVQAPQVLRVLERLPLWRAHMFVDAFVAAASRRSDSKSPRMQSSQSASKESPRVHAGLA